MTLWINLWIQLIHFEGGGIIVTKTQIQTAKKVNLQCFLQDNFPDTIKYDYKTKSFRNSNHDSLVINKHAWYQFSSGNGGDTIEYLIRMHNMSFVDAVELLAAYGCDAQQSADINFELSDKKAPFKMPQKASKINSLFRYMVTRQIPSDTVQKLVDADLVFEDRRSNVVFTRNDDNKRMCIIKGTGEKRSFNKIVTEVPHNYWSFTAGDNLDSIYVCESPIDAISLYEYLGRADGVYTAMAGLKPLTLKRILNEQNKNNDKKVYIAVDWDDAGKKFCKEYNLEERFNILTPPGADKNLKDWNQVIALSKSL